MNKKKFPTTLEYEYSIIKKLIQELKDKKELKILLICPDYNVIDFRNKLLSDKDLNIVDNFNEFAIDFMYSDNKELPDKYIEEYPDNILKGDIFDSINVFGETYNIIISTRLIEHLSINDNSYLSYLLGQICEDYLVVTYPNMDIISDKLKKLLSPLYIENNILDIELYNLEMFNTGQHIYDYHKTYTTPELIQLLYTKEGIFEYYYFEDEISLITNRQVYSQSIFKRRR